MLVCAAVTVQNSFNYPTNKNGGLLMTMNVAGMSGDGSKGPESGLKFPPIGLLTGLLATSIGYAFLLSTEEGQRWDRKHTWFVTVIGVFLTLGWLAVDDPKAAFKALICFMVSGSPIVFRALFLENAKDSSLIRRNVQ
jgi:hypothetical protein